MVKRHQFDSNISHYEKSYFNNQHDHLILTDTGEVIEFCDPRLHTIKQNIEEIFDVKIDSHSLYFYGKKINLNNEIDLILGLQWGDEGKIVDVLADNYDIIARFQGGPNAGHTLEFDEIKHVLHTIHLEFP